jgi:hypothetical protein
LVIYLDSAALVRLVREEDETRALVTYVRCVAANPGCWGHRQRWPVSTASSCNVVEFRFNV